MQGEIPAQNISSLGQVLRAVGGLTKPSGRGLFMFQSLISGSSCAAVLGLLGASLMGYAFTAGAAGFVGGSCIGFILGTLGYFQSSYNQSLYSFMKYPDLLRHHLSTDFGMHRVGKIDCFWDKDAENVVKVLRSDIALQGMLIAAWHSAVPAIEDIQAQKEESLVSNYGHNSRLDNE
ncbi:hypothetical protein BDV59DRAFT_188086 [Aspergillus ambiguus]|uniref:uncharacterized protein n=1 Tax=Aspergillus ambiguus TaxID=176160 RepID=UPI003CCE0461